MKLEDDLTFSLADYADPETDTSSPASITDRVLQRLRAVHPREMALTDLASDPLCGGKVTAIRKALQRLDSRGLIQRVGVRATGARGAVLYQAVVSRDMCVNVCPSLGKPSAGLESKSGQPMDVSLFDGAPKANEDTTTPCPDLLPSRTKGSGGVGQVLEDSPREERTTAELEAIKQAASEVWE